MSARPHAIFVRKGATQRFDAPDTIPEVFKTRTLSLRGFDADGMMVATDLVDGRLAAPAIEAIFADRAVATIHAHHAAPGCFAAQIDRVYAVALPFSRAAGEGGSRGEVG